MNDNLIFNFIVCRKIHHPRLPKKRTRIIIISVSGQPSRRRVPPSPISLPPCRHQADFQDEDNPSYSLRRSPRADHKPTTTLPPIYVYTHIYIGVPLTDGCIKSTLAVHSRVSTISSCLFSGSDSI